MARVNVKVYNRGPVEYREKFKDDMIIIPAGGCVSMNRSEAINFLGVYGGNDPETGIPRVKKLEIVGEVSAEEKHICNLDGRVFETAAELAEHVKTHAGETFKDEKLEEANKVQPETTGIICPLCKVEVKNKDGLRKHLARYCKASEG